MAKSEPASQRLRATLVTWLTPPFGGRPLRAALQLLRANQFDIDPIYWPKLALNVVASGLTSLMKWREERKYGRDADVVVPPPLFVLGHYRSGTTLLHNLLATDRRFTFPTMFRIYNPYTFRVFEPFGTPLVSFGLPRRRIVDGMTWGTELPQEDELALLMLSGMSPYLGFVFSRRWEQYQRYLSFREVASDVVKRWKDAFGWFARKLTSLDGRPLLFKSPPHTARVRLLLELFPDARFVHVHRDPYDVFRSTRQLFVRVTNMVGFQRPAMRHIEDRVLRHFQLMHDAYFDDRPLIPAGRLHEVRFADLERDPLSQVEQIYERLKLPDFVDMQPALAAYVATLRGYRKNEYAPLPEAQRRVVAATWQRSFAEWGYAE